MTYTFIGGPLDRQTIQTHSPSSTYDDAALRMPPTFPLHPPALSSTIGVASASQLLLIQHGATAMHSAACPSCRNRVEFDFVPVAGLVWCPVCQKLFSPTGRTQIEEPADRKDDTQQQSQPNTDHG
jgi:hypothetical protein